MNFSNFKKSIFNQLISSFILVAFFITSVVPPSYAQMMPGTVLNLPAPGTIVSPTAMYAPVIIKGITIHPEDPLQMSFIVNSGDNQLDDSAFANESDRLIRYFLASLTVPESELWVNLSPYEKDRIVPNSFGKTQMGRDLLAQDYMLKQLTSSMMYPEDEMGQEFWKRVHKLAYEKFGTTDIPMNTFNKIWIVPEKAVIYEHDNSAVIVESKLKVLLEEDYLALQNHNASTKHGVLDTNDDIITGVSLDVVREVLIPEIEKEINHGKTFTQLRQIYNSVILANWYKENLKESFLGKVYVDQKKTRGIESEDKEINQKIYEQYVDSFKRGVYNYIKEDYDPHTEKVIPRHYYSGGGDLTNTPDQAIQAEEDLTQRQLVSLRAFGNRNVDVRLDNAMTSIATEGQEVLVERLDPAEGKIKEGSGAQIYGERVVKAKWYQENLAFDLDPVVARVRADGQDVVLDASAGTAGASVYLLEKLRSENKRIKKLVLADVGYGQSRGYMEYARAVLYEQYSDVVDEIEFYILPKIDEVDGVDVFAKVSDIPGLTGVNHVVLENAVHLIPKRELSPTFKAIKSVMDTDYSFFTMGSGDIQDLTLRPDNALGIHDQFDMVAMSIVALVNMDGRYENIRSIFNDRHNKPEIQRAKASAFPTSNSQADIYEALADVGFETPLTSGADVSAYNIIELEREDYKPFITGIKSYVQSRIIPELAPSSKTDDPFKTVRDELVDRAYEDVWNNPVDQFADGYEMLWTRYTVNNSSQDADSVINRRDHAMLSQLKEMGSRQMPPDPKKARPSVFSIDPENVGKFYGRIEANEGFFNVNKAVESAIDENKATDKSSELKGLVLEYLEQEGVQAVLADLGLDLKSLVQFLSQENIHYMAVEDLKNGSPVLVMRDKDNYQVDHVGRKNENMYMGQGLYKALSESSSAKNQKLLKVWALRQLITLYISSKVTESTDDRLRATAQAQELAEKLEKKLVNEDLDVFIQESVNTFINQYFEKLKHRAVVYDHEYSLLTEEQGVYLVGGKSYQAAIEWAREPEEYLRTFSGTARASELLLAVGGAELFAKIKSLIEALDPKDEEQNERVSQTIQNMILELEVPERIRTEIVEAYRKSGGRYAVRSSGRAEDKELKERAEELRRFQTGSNAGQHETGLGVLGEDAVVDWWLIDVASLFSKAVLGYRDTLMIVGALNTFFVEGSATKIKDNFSKNKDEYGALIVKAIEDPENRIKNLSSIKLLEALQRHNKAGLFDAEIKTIVEARETFMNLDNIAMGVTFMPMADAPISYVAFGHDIETGWTGMHFQDIHPDEYKNRLRVATITTTYHIGETIVQGKGTPDTFKVHVFTDENGKEHINIVSRKLGDKTVQTIYTAPVMEELGLKDSNFSELYDILEAAAEVLGDLESEDLTNAVSQISEKLTQNSISWDLINNPIFNVSNPEKLKTALSILGVLVSESVENTNAKIAQLSDQQKDMFKFEGEDLKNAVHLLKAKLEKPKTQTMFTDVPEELRGIYSASDSQVVKIAERMIKNADYYGRLLDTEGVIGENLGIKDKVITVQRRPSTAIGDVDNPTQISINETYVQSSVLKPADPNKGEVDVDVNDKPQIRASIENLFKERLGNASSAESALQQLDAFLEERALPKAGNYQVNTDADNPILVKDLLVEGVPTRNAFSGVLIVVEMNKPLIPQLARIYALAESGVQIVLRTRETTPDFMEVLKHQNVVAVIADAGGSTSHAAVVSRELNIATIVGVETYAKSLRIRHGERKAKAMLDYINTSGNTITVDANQSDETGNGRAFAGLLPISERDIEMDTDRFPNIFTKVGYISGTPFPSVKMSKISQYSGYGGVVLMRGEFLYAEENINPRMGRAYDSMLIHDVLKLAGIKHDQGDAAAEAFMESLHKDEQAAVMKFMFHLENRATRRAKGTPIEFNQAEKIIEYYQENGGFESFWDSLDLYRREDIRGLRRDAVHTEEERRKDSMSERLSAIQLVNSQLLGSVWYDDFFNRVHGESISLLAAANALKGDQWVTYRIIDFKGNESRNLIGGEIVNPESEPSTMLGERGGRWLLQPENQVIYREELKMMLRQIDRGYTNIAVMLPFVSTPQELAELLEILEQEEHKMSRELKRSVYFRKVKMMVELPSNIIQAKQFVKVLRESEARQKAWHKQNYGVDIVRKSGLSFGTNDLTQTSESADRENPIWKKFFDEGHESVIDSLKYVASLSAELEMECEICGQALANVPDDVAEEIMIILGMTNGAIGTDYLGTQRAINISGRATMKYSILSRNINPSELLADSFTSSLKRGAATRALVKVKSQTELNHLTKASIGEFVQITNNKIVLDLTDDATRANVIKLGAVLYTNGFPEELKAGIEALGVPTIKLKDTASISLSRQRQGSYITVDFNGQRIYKGKKKRIDTKVNTDVIDLSTSIKVYEKEDDRDVASKDFDYTVKANDVYSLNNIHPMALLAYDNTAKDSESTRRQDLKSETVEFIENLLEKHQVTSAKELIAVMIKKQFTISSERDDSPSFVYESLALKSDVGNTLVGHEAASVEEEPNPALGFFGMDTMSDQVSPNKLYRELFSLEMRAIKELANEKVDVSLELSYFRKISTLETVVGILDGIGLDSQSVPRGLRANTVNSYLYANRFIELGEFSFVTIDQEELLETYIAADVKQNKRVRAFYSADNWSRVRESLGYPERMIRVSAYENDIPLRGVPLPDMAMTASASAPNPFVYKQLLNRAIAEHGKGEHVVFGNLAEVWINREFAIANKEEIKAGIVYLAERLLKDRGIDIKTRDVPYSAFSEINGFELGLEGALTVVALGKILKFWKVFPEDKLNGRSVQQAYSTDRTGINVPEITDVDLAALGLADAAMLVQEYPMFVPDGYRQLAAELIILWARENRLEVSMQTESDYHEVSNDVEALRNFIAANSGTRVLFTIDAFGEITPDRDREITALWYNIISLFNTDVQDMLSEQHIFYNRSVEGYVPAIPLEDPAKVVDALIKLNKSSAGKLTVDWFEADSAEVNNEIRNDMIVALSQDDRYVDMFYATSDNPLVSYRLLNNALAIMSGDRIFDADFLIQDKIRALTEQKYTVDSKLRELVKLSQDIDPKLGSRVELKAESDRLQGEIEQLEIAFEQYIDAAMTGKEKDLGGIDLDPNLFEIEKKGNGTLTFPKFNGDINNININGLIPVIINVAPINSLPLLLGLRDTADDESNDISYDSLDPADKKARFETDHYDQLSLLKN